MGPQKKLIIFADLEGTLLRDSDKQYDEREMYGFLSKVSKLQQKANLIAEIHLVSPMILEVMKGVMDRMDKTIRRYNSIHQAEGKQEIPYITGATASPEVSEEDCYLVDDRILPLPKRYTAVADSSAVEKEHYVKSWLEALTDRVGMVIYCGNDMNDLFAMKYVKGLFNGYSICPDNSKDEIKANSNFVGKQNDLLGITEGLEYVLERISKRETPTKADDFEK